MCQIKEVSKKWKSVVVKKNSVERLRSLFRTIHFLDTYFRIESRGLLYFHS